VVINDKQHAWIRLGCPPGPPGGGVQYHAYSVPACWFRSTAVIIRVAVALKAALKSKLASTAAGPSIGVLASAR